MTNKAKDKFYDEQVPELLDQLRRIAAALERQVELTAERQDLFRETLEAGQAQQQEQRDLQRERLRAQLEKLAEVDRMARELRRKLEEKQAAEGAALTAQTGDLPNADGDPAPSEEEAEGTEPSPIPTHN